jgi:hypothetical protein
MRLLVVAFSSPRDSSHFFSQPQNASFHTPGSCLFCLWESVCRTLKTARALSSPPHRQRRDNPTPPSETTRLPSRRKTGRNREWSSNNFRYHAESLERGVARCAPARIHIWPKRTLDSHTQVNTPVQTPLSAVRPAVARHFAAPRLAHPCPYVGPYPSDHGLPIPVCPPRPNDPSARVRCAPPHVIAPARTSSNIESILLLPVAPFPA